MTERSELSHRLSELKVRMQMTLAMRLFTRSRSGVDGFVKRLMKVDKSAEHHDPELEHPSG